MTRNNLIKKTQNLKGVTILRVEENTVQDTLYVYIRPHKHKKHVCPFCNKKASGYDVKTKERQWRGLDMGTYKVIIVTDVHRICCPEHGVVTEKNSWSFHGSRFTKKFEQQAAYLAVHQSKKLVCEQMRINWRTVGSIISRVKKAKEKDPEKKFSNLVAIGIDETSYRKGHTYLTTVVDHTTGEVIWAHDGFGKNVLEEFFRMISNSCAESIQMASGDGARWIKDTVQKHAPHACFCIDPYHVVSWAIEAMDLARRRIWREAYGVEKLLPKRNVGRPKKGEEPAVKESKVLKGARYPLGKNPENLTEKQAAALEEIRTVYPRLFRAYQLKEGLRAIFHMEDGVETELNKWLSWACRCRIPEFVSLSKKIRRHRESILNTMKYGLSNARIEATNNKIKLVIRRSYGFGNVQNLIDMIMLVCSNLGRTLRPAYEADEAFD